MELVFVAALTRVAAAPALDLPAAALELTRAGWIPLRQLLHPQQAADVWRPAVEACVEQQEAACAQCTEAELADITNSKCYGCLAAAVPRSGGAAVRSFRRANDLHRDCRRVEALLLESDEGEHLARTAAGLLSTGAVRLYKSTAFFKSDGHTESSWHQDHAAVPLATNGRFVTLWIALDPIVDPSQGPLRFARGTHLKSTPRSISLQTLPLGERIAWMRALTDADIAAACSSCAIESAPLPLAPGDATAHLGYTLHSAGEHRAGRARPRRALALSYFADGAPLEAHLFTTRPDARGIMLTADDGSQTVVQVSADDTSTWLPWLLARPPHMAPPPAPLRSEVFAPLYDFSPSAERGRKRERRQRVNVARKRKRSPGGRGKAKTARRKQRRKSRAARRKREDAERRRGGAGSGGARYRGDHSEL